MSGRAEARPSARLGVSAEGAGHNGPGHKERLFPNCRPFNAAALSRRLTSYTAVRSSRSLSRRFRISVELSQKAREIFVFPTTRAFVKAEFAFAAIEFVGVNTASAISLRFVRHDGVQHFVIQDVFEEPERNEFLIEPRIDSNHAIFFLDCTENKIFFRPFATFPAPNHFVTAQTIAEMTRVYFIEEITQIEIASFSFQT